MEMLISLFVAYSLWKYFLGHQGSHLAYYAAGNAGYISPTNLNLLVWYNRLGTILGLAFLIYFGYQTKWYLALAFFFLGFVGQFLLVFIETRLGLQKDAGRISLTAIGVLPFVYSFMIYVVSMFK